MGRLRSDSFSFPFARRPVIAATGARSRRASTGPGGGVVVGAADGADVDLDDDGGGETGKVSGLEEGEFREPLAQVAAVDGGEAVGLDSGVGGDEEIGDEMLAWTAGLAVALEGETGKVGGGGRDGIVGDGEPVEELREF